MAQINHDTKRVSDRAFEYFTHGLVTGEWNSFIDILTEDFTFWFPVGPYHGLNVGKERARPFSQYVRETFSEGLTLTLDHVTSNETTVVFEFQDQGLMWGNPYKNRVAVSFDVRGDKICGYREYFGSDGKSN